jgi:phage-related protein
VAKKLVVEIVGDSSSLDRAFRNTSQNASKFGRTLRSVGKLAALGVGAAFAGMAVVVKQGFDELAEGQKVASDTAAILKATGGVANVTAKDVANLAESQSKLTGVDDELIQSAENLLLTFKNVRNEVGLNNDIFNRATAAGLDLAQVGFGTPESAAKMLGKALNDPIKGMSALGRAGVTFSAAQKETIKGLVDTGDLLGAQKVILGEVESQVGGTAKAFGETMPGQLNKLRNSFSEVAAQVADVLLPYLLQLVTWVNANMPTIQRVMEAVLDGIVAAIEFIGPIISKVIAWFESLNDSTQQYWPQIQATIQKVIVWFRTSVVPTVQQVVATITELWRKFGDDVLRIVEPVFRIIFAVIKTSMQNILAIIQFVMAILRGDWGKAWDALKAIVSNTLNGIKTIATQILGSLVPAVLNLALQIGKSIIRGILQGLANLGQSIKGAFAALPGVLAGVAASAAGWAADIGRAIIRGVLSGLTGLASAIKDKVSSAVGDALSHIDVPGFSPVEQAGAKAIGEPIMEGAAKGVDSKKAAVAEAAAKAAREAVAKAAEAVKTAQGSFASAFGELASVAMSAFDAAAANWKAPAQILLDKRALAKSKQDLKQGLQDAQAEVIAAQQEFAAATAGGDVAAIQEAQQRVLAANKAKNDAIAAQEDFNLAQAAARQTAAHDKEVARDKIHFENRLGKLQGELAKFTKSGGELTAAESKKYQKHLNDLLKDYGIDARFWGTAIGISLADGLKQAQGAVRTAALTLARMIAKALKTKSPTEEGPMADLDTWWAGLVPTLIGGIDFQAAKQAGIDLAASLRGGVESSPVGGLAGMAMDFSNAQPVPPAVTESLGATTEAVTTATTEVNTFTTAITNLPTIAATAFAALASAIKLALKPLPSILDPATLAADALALAIHGIGEAAYYTRAALKDTADEIVALNNKINAATGPGRPLPGRAAGGPVRAGQPYIVGEVGPELFVPSQSGTIHTASDTANMAMGGGMVVNLLFNGPTVGTSREFEDTVRRALYDVSRRNPGSGLVLA